MLRVGVIGGGYGGSVHLPAFRRLDGVEVVAVADGGSGRIAAQGVPYFDSWQGLLDVADLDAVTIAAPPALHAPIVMAALGRGLHVLCEKPFGRDPEEADAMTAALPPGVVGAVGYQFRYEAGLAALRDLVTRGRIGRLRRIDIRWITSGRADPLRPWGFQHDAAAGGGVIESFLCHCLDYVLWLTGRAVERVVARSDILIAQRVDAGGMTRTVTAEDSVDVMLDLAGGITVTATVTNCQPGGNLHRISLSGDAGWAELDQQIPAGPHRLTVTPAAGGFSVERLEAASGSDTRLAAFRALAGDFCAAIAGAPAADLPRFADGARVRHGLAALRRSLETGAWQSCTPSSPVEISR